jgi:hypothetical protein
MYNKEQLEQAFISAHEAGDTEAASELAQALKNYSAPKKDEGKYGLRQDGTKKGSGYFGELQTADGKVATEMSVSVDFGMGEKEIPLLVPTLTEQEKQDLLTNNYGPNDIPENIMKKAVNHAKARQFSGKGAFADEPEDTSGKNWAGTGPKQSFTEYMGSGFAGRILTGVGERIGKSAAALMMDEEELAIAVAAGVFNDPIPVKHEGPTPTVMESLKMMGEQIVQNPGQTLKGFIYEAGKDPELLIPALWEAAPAKIAATLDKIAKANAATKVAVPIASKTARGGAIGSGLELAAQLAKEEEELNFQEVKNVGAAFGVFTGLAKAVHMGWEGYKFSDVFPKLPEAKKPRYSGEYADLTISEIAARNQLNKEFDVRARKGGIEEITIESPENRATRISEKDIIEVIDYGEATKKVDIKTRQQQKEEIGKLEESVTKQKEEVNQLNETIRRLEEESGIGESQGARLADQQNAGAIRSNRSVEALRERAEELKNSIAEQEANIQRRIGEVVPPKFLNKAKPHWMEIQDALWKVDNLADGLSVLAEAGVGNKSQRFLMELLRNNSLVKDAKLFVDAIDNIITKPDGRQVIRKGEADNLSGDVRLFNGADLHVLLHEAVHTATTRAIDGPLTGREFRAIFDRYKKFAKDTPLDQMYGFTNAREFAAEAFTNLKFQQALNKITGEKVVPPLAPEVVGKQPTLWNRFKEAVSDTLGLSKKDLGRTALNEVLDSGAKLIERNLELPEQVAHALKEENVKFPNAEAAELIDKTGFGNFDPHKIVVDTIRNIRERVRLSEIYRHNIEKAIPDLDSRIFITKALENPKMFERAARISTIQNIAEVGMQIQSHLRNIGERAKAEGLVEDLLNNYVTHILDFTQNKLSEAQTKSLMDRVFNQPKDSLFYRDFAAHRHYDTIRQLEEVFKGTGIKVEKDIAKIVEIYSKSMETALLHKKMLDTLSIERAIDDLPYVTKDMNLAKANKYVHFNGKGSKALENYAVHPDIADSFNFIWRQSDPGLITRSLGAVSYLAKSLNTVASLFHAYSLGTASATTAPLAFAKEVFSGLAGSRRAFNDFKTKVDSRAGEWIESGLVLGTEDIQRSIIAQTGIATDALLTRMGDKISNKFGREGPEIKLTSLVTEPLDKFVIQKANKFTWDYMHTGQKLHVANVLYSKMLAKNPKMEPKVAREEISRYINNTFGGLDWADVAGQVQNKFARAVAMKAASIQGREWAQIVLFAPDWTVSTLRAFTTALPKEITKPKNWELREGIKGMFNPKTQGDLARRYVMNTAIAWATILNGVNFALNGRMIWSNDDPTRIDLPDGTSVQAAKHSMEAAHWLMAPDKTLGNKLGFWPKALFVATTATAYPSPTAPKLKDTSAVGRAKAVAMLGAPFQVSSAASAPPGERAKRAAMSTLGIPIYGQKDPMYQSPEVRMERMRERANTKAENQKEKLKEMMK